MTWNAIAPSIAPWLGEQACHGLMQRVGMMTGVDSWPMGTAHGRRIMAITYVQHVCPMTMCGVAVHGHGEGKIKFSPVSA